MKLKHVLAVSGLVWLATGSLSAQEKAAAPACGNCTNIAPDGDMMSIPTSGQGYLNTFGLNWKSSHGSPSYSPGSLWMWSYNNSGEGVYYDGVTFLAGHTYCITFDTYTRTHDGTPPVADAAFHVIATNSLTPMESLGGGGPIPSPLPRQVVATQSWSPLPNGGYSTFSYTFTPTTNWSQLWFYPRASALPQVELTLMNLRICDISAPPDPCNFQANFEFAQEKCYTHFYPYVYLGAGLTAAGYHWDFGDGSTSDEMSPLHFYTMPGSYTVTLTVLVINSNGDCCARSFKQDIFAEACDPCEQVNHNTGYISDKCNSTFTFSATGPDAPGFVYVWNFGDGTTGNGHDVTHTYGSPGSYVVSVTAYYYNEEAGICCHMTYYFDVSISSAGTISTKALGNQKPVKEPVMIPESFKERPGAVDAETHQIELFPNPSTGLFTVSSKDRSEISSIEIYDLSGRLIRTIEGGSKRVEVDMSSELAGTYEVKVLLKNGETFTRKLVRK